MPTSTKPTVRDAVRAIALGGGRTLQFIPGRDNAWGQSYFWIGDQDGSYYADIDAEELAAFVADCHEDGATS